jgi:hypothetical protein
MNLTPSRVVAALSLTAAATLGAHAAVGQTIRNDDTMKIVTKHGSAVRLVTKDGSAPFQVTSGARVDGLNADKLDGLDAQTIQDQAVAAAAAAVPKSGPVLRIAPWGLGVADVIHTQSFSATVPTGDYLVSLQGLLSSAGGSGGDPYSCGVSDKLSAESGDRSAISSPILSQNGDAAQLAALDQQVFLHLDGSRPLRISCTFAVATRQIKPVQVLFQPLAVQDVTATPYPAG